MLIVQVRRYRNETDETNETNDRMPTADGERERRTLTLGVADQLGRRRRSRARVCIRYDGENASKPPDGLDGRARA